MSPSLPNEPNQPDSKSPNAMALAMEWVSRIMVVSLEMVLPGVVGQWLDHQYGTQFIALVGFVVGISLAMWHLILMTQPKKTPPNP